jgi:hypothetical protein
VQFQDIMIIDQTSSVFQKDKQSCIVAWGRR